MKLLTQRRMKSLTVTLTAVVLTWFCVDMISQRLGDEATFTGLILLISIVSLYLLSIRKAWITCRLGPVAAWLQMHVYVGVFASLIFLTHIRWPVRGPFELCLAACFLFVAVSGMALGIMSRMTPRRLAAIKHEFAFEQIPALQFSLAEDAHRAAISSTKQGEGATLSEYYQRRLLPYFQGRRGWLFQLLPTSILRRKLLRELEDLDRYLSSSGLGYRKQLSAFVQSKDDLDYHFALQSRLRLFFTLHVALTWTLVVLIAVHVVLVLRFSGALI